MESIQDIFNQVGGFLIVFGIGVFIQNLTWPHKKSQNLLKQLLETRQSGGKPSGEQTVIYRQYWIRRICIFVVLIGLALVGVSWLM